MSHEARDPGAATPAADPAGAYWARRAAAWGRVRPPWRPSPEVIAATAALAELPPGGTTLLLGVTPELAELAAARGRLVAVDRSEAMIAALWRDRGPLARARCADWRRLPLEDGSVDLVLGDGVLSLLCAEDRAALAAELHRVLRPGTAFVTRIFARPRSAEPAARLFERLRRGELASAESLRMRLLAALHSDAHDEGVPVSALWQALRAEVPDPVGLARMLGWPPESFLPFEDGRDVPDRLYLPPADTLAELLGERFALEARQETDPDTPGCCHLLRFRRV